jgi:hypothetical protein
MATIREDIGFRRDTEGKVRSVESLEVEARPWAVVGRREAWSEHAVACEEGISTEQAATTWQ